MSILSTTGLALLSLLAMTATASPVKSVSHVTRQDSTFKLNVKNNCAWSKDVALYQITDDFEMLEMSTPTTILSGDSITIDAPYLDIGMRLSGHAELGCAGQWEAQALFEFGYSAWGDIAGTAYDLSVMEGSEEDVGISVVPSNGNCPSKSCSPSDCPMDQGWTNADQVDDGSPADVVCYEGVTEFSVTWCP